MGRAFLIAVQFLTTVPLSRLRPPSEEEVGQSILFYPVVGLIIGACLAAVAWLAHPAGPDVQAVLVLGTWVLLTGALHLDGLADSADAWVGGLGNRERTLAIMKDPCSGPVGVVTLVLVLLMKFAATKGVLTEHAFVPLVVTPIIGRTAIPILFLTTPYVRHGGLGSSLASNLPKQRAYTMVYITVLACCVVALKIVWLFAVAAALFIGLRAWMIRGIAGATGDLAGALVELTEAVVLVAAAFIYPH